MLGGPTCAFAEDNPFAQGTWNVSLSGGYTRPIRFSEATTYNLTGTIGKYLWDNVSLNGEVEGRYADQPGDTCVLIGGIGVLGRIHLWRHDDWSIFFDGGGGVT